MKDICRKCGYHKMMCSCKTKMVGADRTEVKPEPKNEQLEEALDTIRDLRQRNRELAEENERLKRRTPDVTIPFRNAVEIMNEIEKLTARIEALEDK